MNKTSYARLTITERKSLEHSLHERNSIKSIAATLHRHPSTISRELLRNACVERTGSLLNPFNNCKHHKLCDQSKLCFDNPDCTRSSCTSCQFCFTLCQQFERVDCDKLKRPPYVCNGCKSRSHCSLEKFVYRAAKAQRIADATGKDTRSGICMSEEERDRLDGIVSPLLKKGQSPQRICKNHASELMLSPKTLYKYVHAGLFDATNFDLYCKLKMQPRRKKKPIKIERNCRKGRTIEDFHTFALHSPNFHVVQMDTVIGEKGVGQKVLLTLHFPAEKLMLAFLREANTAHSVLSIFDELEMRLGHDGFCQIFGSAILTDNGPEFSNPSALETGPDGRKRTHIFYCDPGASYQKAEVENNHRFIRKISPKGTSFNGLTQDAIDLMMSHINSYGRASLEGQTPFDAFQQSHPWLDMKKLGLRFIHPDDVTLHPNLFK